MDILLSVIGLILCLIGLLGSFLPILPGPIASWFGLLALNFTNYVSFSFWFLFTTFLIAITISVLDYIIPIVGVQKLGGTKGGQLGATIGLIFGLFLIGPLGLIFGPFIGAFTGEIISNKNIRRIIFLKDLKLSFFDKIMLIKYKKIVIKSIKLPILENDVIIPIVINIIKNLM